MSRAAELLASLALRGLSVRLEGEGLKVEGPKGALDAPLKAALAEAKVELLAHLRAQGPSLSAPLRFSVFYFSADEEAPGAHEELLALGELADRLGCEALWLPERHFHALGGLFSAPAVLAGALAMRTQRLALRAGSVVAPLHDPMRIAEAWASVDRLSGGRVGLAFASGWHADDFAFAPERYAERRRHTAECLQTVQRLWRGEALPRTNGTGQQVALALRPKPVQPELPAWYTAIGRVEGFEEAGRLGANLLTCLLGQSVAELGEKVARYRAAWVEAGHPGQGQVTVMLHAYVGIEREAVKARVRAPFQRYLGGALELLGPLAKALGGSLDLATLPEADREALLAHAFEAWWSGSALLGDEGDALRMLRALQGIGVQEVGCLVDWGLSLEEVSASLARIVALGPKVGGGA